ncbi:MAG: hypothetical protein F6K26_10695 [Moorea sp. SIO2I5]|nr:hypothetical protein [Moorena sp. SIO2I5]
MQKYFYDSVYVNSCPLFPIPCSLFPTSARSLLFPVPCSRLDAKREWGKPRQSASGGDPQDRAAFPRPRCIAVPFEQFRYPNLKY